MPRKKVVVKCDDEKKNVNLRKDTKHYLFGKFLHEFPCSSLPTKLEVMCRILCERQLYLNYHMKGEIKVPVIDDDDLKTALFVVLNELKNLWKLASIPVIKDSAIYVHMKRFFDENYRMGIKRQNYYKDDIVKRKEWIQETRDSYDTLFDICACICVKRVKSKNIRKTVCQCDDEMKKLPAAELEFYIDQRTTRKLHISSNKDLKTSNVYRGQCPCLLEYLSKSVLQY